MVTPEFAADIDRRLHELYDRGVADFGEERVAELIAIERAPVKPDEASDTRSLKELMWFKEAADIVVDEAAKPVLDFSVRVNDAMVANGVDNPDYLPPEVRGPLEEEGRHVMLIRQALSNFGFDL